MQIERIILYETLLTFSQTYALNGNYQQNKTNNKK